MSYRSWYERFPRMFDEEREEMERRGFRLDQAAKTSLQQIHFVGSSRWNSTELIVKYPDSFPSKAPRVFTRSEAPLLSRHHHPTTREICTFGPGQSRWSAQLTGGDAIEEAERVIADMAMGEKSGLMDDAPEPVSSTYDYTAPFSYVLVPPDIAQLGSRLVPGKLAKFELRFKSWPGTPEGKLAAGRGVIIAVQADNVQSRTGSHYQEFIGPTFEVRTGALLRVAGPPPSFRTSDELSSWLESVHQDRRDLMCFIFPEQMGQATASRDAWLVVRSAGPRKPQLLRTFVMDGSGRRTRVPGLGALSSKKVVLIGCGSMGSKIGASLAATGIERFGLVDFDFLEPDNAVRHEAGVGLFGVNKTHAVAQRLLELNPEVAGKGDLCEIIIGGNNDRAQEALLQQLIASASLVIETTGDHGVSRFINDICSEFRIPQLYATVTNGAWGGEVVRVIPGKRACWLCWNDQYYGSAPAGEPALGPGVFAPGCDQPTFTGTTYEVGIVANFACEMAVDTLLIDDGDRKHFNGDYLRWQLKDADGNLSPRIEVLEVEKRPDCSACERSGL